MTDLSDYLQRIEEEYVQEPTKIGYHIVSIPKGTLGEVSKIREELAELEDAMDQHSKVMAAVECSDLIGAIEAFAEKHLNLTLLDLIKFKNITKRAFENGARS